VKGLELVDYDDDLRERLWRWWHRRCVIVSERRPEYRTPEMIAAVPHRKCRDRIEAETNEDARRRADRRG